MGCLCAKKKKESDVDDRKGDYTQNPYVDKDKYTIDSLIDGEQVQLPGSINGQQFLIHNCRNSTMYLLDHMNTASVYDCIDSKIVLGPVKGSVYIGNCENCIFVSASGQLRIRDSRRIHAFIHCETQPAIEASSGIFFGKYTLSYDSLDEHMRLAYLNLKRKNWNQVHDFTPIQNETNWKFIEREKASDYFIGPVSGEIAEKLESCKLSWRNEDELIPRRIRECQ